MNRNFYSLRRLVLIASLLILNAGCSQQFLFSEQSPKEKLEISVAPSDRPGVYKVAGTTNLPDQSRIVVAAIRYLRPTNELFPSLNQNLTYSILAYQDAVVAGGKWQTTLNLWRVAPDGQFREAWQEEQAELGLSVAPLTQTAFIATLSSPGQLPELAKQLEKQVMKLSNSFIKYTSDGQRYVQVSQILPVALPSGRTTPPQQRPEDFNYGWGDRYVIKPEEPNPVQLESPKEHRTNAPLSPAEILH